MNLTVSHAEEAAVEWFEELGYAVGRLLKVVSRLNQLD